MDSRFRGNDGGEVGMAGAGRVECWGAWIPAFVGMTVGRAGMAEAGAAAGVSVSGGAGFPLSRE